MNRFFAVLLLALSGAAIQAEAATISLSAPSEVTGAFDVTVLATGVFDAPHTGDGLFGYGFDILFNPSSLSYLGETAGPLFEDISGNTGFDSDAGGIATAGFLVDGDFAEPLVLATLHFDLNGFGPITISVNADSQDPNQGLAYLSTSDSFNASAVVSAVPEPGTFVLGGFLIIGLLARRR
jgi:hypothetical protein